ncbi:hypothetical protein [Actinomycetospora lemnae]|uniref:Uncharacterized protein n=1 Tax=Actinomycetospora lemnae TaxID=3019891 RepID=A0ABT5SWR3_9PSEU|nr:hypothetical protein [Actinomycetospora sp. DW7H6]MDD7967300.1 hypothetical protein [Actinomycetospora sp. DW7H6]
MNVVVALILFSAAVTFLAVKTRAAGVALLSGVFCALLLCAVVTGLPGAIADGTQFVGNQGAEIANAATSGDSSR